MGGKMGLNKLLEQRLEHTLMVMEDRNKVIQRGKCTR